MSQNNPHILERERERERERVNKLIKLSPWIMLRLHFQLKPETKLATYIEL